MTVEELAKEIGAEVAGDGSATIASAATLEDAQAGQVSFLANPKYAKQLETTKREIARRLDIAIDNIRTVIEANDR